MSGVDASALGWVRQEPFGSDAPSVVERASGDVTHGGNFPAYGWATIIGLLILVRWVYEKAE